MKIIFGLLCFFSSVSITLHAENNILSCEKTYVTPNQLCFTESSFFVEIDSLWVQPASLQVDDNGIYFNSIFSNEVVPGPLSCAWLS